MIDSLKAALLMGKKKPAPNKVVEATAKAPVRIRSAEGAFVDLKPGESAEVLEAEVFGNSKLTYTRKADPNAPKPRDLVPARREARPVPENLRSLPECFSRAFEQTDRLDAAIEHVTAVRRTIKRFFPAGAPKNCDRILHADLGCDYEGRKTWSRIHSINLTPTSRAEFRILERADEAAWGFAKDLLEQSQEPRVNALLDCSRHRMELHHRRNKLAAELNETAFELFRTRIKFLGLGRDREFAWFRGSVVYLKYWREPRRPLVGAVFIEGEQMVLQPLNALATHCRNDQAEIDEMEPLLKEAKAELKKARAVMPEQLELP